MTRIGEGVAAADAVGWPVNVRAGLFEPDGKSRCLRRPALTSFEHMLDLNRPSRPRLSDLPRLCREARAHPSPNPPPNSAMSLRVYRAIQGRSDKPGDGRLRSRLGAKLLSAGRRRRRLYPSASRRPAGTLTGQPTGLAAAAPWHNRAGDFGRHEQRKRSSFSSICSRRCRFICGSESPPRATFRRNKIENGRLVPCPDYLTHRTPLLPSVGDSGLSFPFPSANWPINVGETESAYAIGQG